MAEEYDSLVLQVRTAARRRDTKATRCPMNFLMPKCLTYEFDNLSARTV